MFFESCKQPQMRQFKIQEVGRLWNNFKCVALHLRWSGSTSMGSEIVVLRKYVFFPPRRTRFVFSASLRSSRKSRGWRSSTFLNNFVEYLPLQIMRCADWPSRPRRVVQVQLSATIQRCYYPTTQNTCVHTMFTIESQLALVTFGKSSIFVVEKHSNNSFDALWSSWEQVTNFELNTSQTNTYTKICAKANLSTSNFEQVGKLVQVPFHGEATWRVTCSELLLSELSE
jgi:hypothetical protein